MTPEQKLAELGLSLPVPDGINLWVPVVDERAALVHLAAAGIRAAPGAPFFAGDGTPHVRLTTGLVTADELEHVATSLVDAARVGS